MALTPKIVSSLTPRGVAQLPDPKAGRVSISANLDFTTPNQYVIDIGSLQAANKMTAPRSVYIDNTQNPSNMSIYIDGTEMTIQFPAFSSGVIPVSTQDQSKITITSQGGLYGTNTETPVLFEMFNFEQAAYVTQGYAPFFSGQNVAVFGRDQLTPLGDSNPVPVSKPIAVGGAPIWRGFTLVANTNKIMLTAPQSTAAFGIRFRNSGDAAGNGFPAYYNFGGAAVIATAPSRLLNPSDLWTELPYKFKTTLEFISAGAVLIEMETF